jgi:hypothetical protein
MSFCGVEGLDNKGKRVYLQMRSQFEALNQKINLGWISTNQAYLR